MSAQAASERHCWKCDDGVLSEVVEDGIVRWFCPNCGIQKRRGRPRTDRRMSAERTGPPTKIA